MAVDDYSTLELDRTATFDEIREAYFRLARTNHPDRNPGDPDAHARFKKIQQAYEVLARRHALVQHAQFLSPIETQLGFRAASADDETATASSKCSVGAVLLRRDATARSRLWRWLAGTSMAAALAAIALGLSYRVRVNTTIRPVAPGQIADGLAEQGKTSLVAALNTLSTGSSRTASPELVESVSPDLDAEPQNAGDASAALHSPATPKSTATRKGAPDGIHRTSLVDDPSMVAPDLSSSHSPGILTSAYDASNQLTRHSLYEPWVDDRVEIDRWSLPAKHFRNSDQSSTVSAAPSNTTSPLSALPSPNQIVSLPFGDARGKADQLHGDSGLASVRRSGKTTARKTSRGTDRSWARLDDLADFGSQRTNNQETSLSGTDWNHFGGMSLSKKNLGKSLPGTMGSHPDVPARSAVPPFATRSTAWSDGSPVPPLRSSHQNAPVDQRRASGAWEYSTAQPWQSRAELPIHDSTRIPSTQGKDQFRQKTRGAANSYSPWSASLTTTPHSNRSGDHPPASFPRASGASHPGLNLGDSAWSSGFRDAAWTGGRSGKTRGLGNGTNRRYESAVPGKITSRSAEGKNDKHSFGLGTDYQHINRHVYKQSVPGGIYSAPFGATPRAATGQW